MNLTWTLFNSVIVAGTANVLVACYDKIRFPPVPEEKLQVPPKSDGSSNTKFPTVLAPSRVMGTVAPLMFETKFAVAPATFGIVGLVSHCGGSAQLPPEVFSKPAIRRDRFHQHLPGRRFAENAAVVAGNLMTQTRRREFAAEAYRSIVMNPQATTCSMSGSRWML